MKHIKLLDDITVTDTFGVVVKNKNDEPFIRKHLDVISERLSDPIVTESYENIEIAYRIKGVIKKARKDKLDYLTLDDKWHEFLWNIIENPKGDIGLHPAVIVCDLPFLKSVKEAVDELPGE